MRQKRQTAAQIADTRDVFLDWMDKDDKNKTKKGAIKDDKKRPKHVLMDSSSSSDNPFAFQAKKAKLLAIEDKSKADGEDGDGGGGGNDDAEEDMYVYFSHQLHIHHVLTM